jgi:hypothetical protein
MQTRFAYIFITINFIKVKYYFNIIYKDGVNMTAKNDLLEGLGVGKTYDDLGGMGICYSDLYSLLKGIGTGVENIYNELDGIGKGTAYDELGSIGQGKGEDELSGLAYGGTAYNRLKSNIKRLSLYDPLELRTTSIYNSTRLLQNLSLVFGDLTMSRVACVPIDAASKVYHISDYEISYIDKVYVDNILQTQGYTANKSYYDGTTKRCACIVFDQPQIDKEVTCSCRGIINPNNGVLIENPADIIEFILLYVQGYDESCIDSIEFSSFKSECSKRNIKISMVLSEKNKLRDTVDKIAFNIFARQKLTDGDAILRLRWRL